MTFSYNNYYNYYYYYCIIYARRIAMPSTSGLMQLGNGSNRNGVVIVGGSSNNNNSRMDGTLSHSMDSVNTVAAEEAVNIFFFCFSIFLFFYRLSVVLDAEDAYPSTRQSPLLFLDG